jgi:hypothetical protein
MNPERFARFADTYKIALCDAVTKYPDEYVSTPGHSPAAYAEIVATRMLGSIEKAGGIGPVNHSGRAFKAACKSLGIKHTRKAITAYLNGDAS